MKIVIIGSINRDYTAQVKKLPEKGETVIASSYKISIGGKGANQAVAAKRLGAQVYMIGAVGNSDGGRDIIKKLESEGIDVSGVLFTEEVTGNAMITIDELGFNTIVVYPGANAKLDSSWIERHSKIIEEADFVILQLEIPLETVETAVKLSKKYNVKVILNPAPAKEIPDEVYKYIDIITPNEVELTQLTGTTDIKDGANMLIEKGVSEVIVTLGEKGSYYTNGQEEIFSEAVPVNTIDSTAAGDSFNAAIAVALCENMNIKSALNFANIVGALTTTKMGAQDSLPYRDEVESFRIKLQK
ncbi:ribokinase [Thermoanaerobacter thermohydrosulfuricus]|uniref:Ribokinase n=2 Tax=Thermoanaerobacter TaxID=1754 RepID=I9KR82_9THEO|nr:MULTISPECIES: ribokinase [Thermoanaerobacter]EIV99393.1 ribokinase [Thermoanaerobacter siderophilus SR4]SDG25777.1 ribokinase [Thermoanaerobacter thermohydrosulfuricus]SFE19266.1 ribokinase [Thermoanaerobacter thermohydrosulfuricus]